MSSTPKTTRPPVVPAGLPALARGRHRGPEHGSCLMEYVSVLAGSRFTDRPGCTPGDLTWLAHRTNDAVGDAVRPALARLAPALIDPPGGTALAPIVLRAIVLAGRDVAPDDARFRRLADRVERPASPLWARWPRTRLLSAHLHLLRVLAHLPAAERDRRLVGVLDRVLEEVWSGVGTPSRGAPERVVR